MYNFLTNHATRYVWCTPGQDNQSITKPARLTPLGGAWNEVDVQWRRIKLPEPIVRFHVYQIGQLHPKLMGLFPVFQTWTSMAEVCRKEKMIVDIYANNGVQLPRFSCYYMWTRDKNLIIAVKEQPKVNVSFDEDDIFVRVYTNAFFASERANATGGLVDVQGGTMRSTADILALQNLYQQSLTREGQTYAFVNGYKVSGIDLFTAKVGDQAEFVYDNSIYKVLDFPVKDLRTFNSTLDAKVKYLLHYEGETELGIDYQDDIDVFLLRAMPNNRHQGIYYHRNMEDAMRMVTHKDYAIPSAYVAGYRDDHPDWPLPVDLTVRLHIRKSGWLRPLVNENYRIKELYKMSDVDIRRAMLGLESVVPFWRAEALEASAYTEIMRYPKSELPLELVERAYGYNAISKLIGDTPRFPYTSSSQRVVDVPYGLTANSTGYEYDQNGYLLSYHGHVFGTQYNCRNVLTRLVEMIGAQAFDRLDEVYGDKVVDLNPVVSYRMYTCPIQNGVPTNKWVDVTGSSKYAVINNKLTWLTDANTYTLVRGDSYCLAQEYDIMMDRGVLDFTLTHRAVRNGVIVTQVMQIPMGELDIWLNGRSLIEGIDYYVQFPRIVIVNKEYLINPQTTVQNVKLRFQGFCKPDMTRDLPEDTGFVIHGMLSRNNKFDIRDDKVLRITVDGKLYDRSELKFSETDSAIRVLDEKNGKPYLIRDLVVPTRGLTEEDTYAMRAKSQVIDGIVSDYLSTKLPQPVITEPSAITERYQVVSPFCCKLLYDLKNKILDDPRLYTQYNDSVVRELCAPYEDLLAFDPTQEDTLADSDFVIVHPHNLFTVIDIDIYVYKFLSRAVGLYLNGLVDLSHHLRLTE